ncbi:hypothetical protein BDZ97DRAFT_458267 [Flammula alnicola]|nr:hypothetical protein BDZ97DRAFT_458267 [Flammula alnicola]
MQVISPCFPRFREPQTLGSLTAHSFLPSSIPFRPGVFFNSISSSSFLSSLFVALPPHSFVKSLQPLRTLVKMLLKSNFGFLALSILLISSEQALGREQWLERDGRAVFLYRRRFGQEQPAVLQKIRDACPGAVCGTLAGQAVTPLLAAQPECSQQDMADAIIDASKQFDAATAAAMVAAAVEYRQVEKNTPPDFTTNPPALRNSVFCQKTPKNPQLNGLVQAQDPSNDPNLFFDPALKATVVKGSQANTFPFGDAASQSAASQAPATTSAAATGGAVLIAQPATTSCVSAVTVTVTGTLTVTPTGAAVTVKVGTPAATSAPAAVTSAAAGPAGANFGSCTVPQIEFGVGFDSRKETSFQPTDKQSFNHGSAQNIDIITQFICDTLTNSCKANQAAKDICATAQKAADALPPQTGAQADAFNAAFGITTNFASVAVVDDTGNVVSTGTGTAATTAAVPAATLVASQISTATAAASTATTAGAAGVGNFGKCSVPQIEFGAGFDGRKETSFQPVDKASFNHGSAQNIDIITQFICDTLTNTCGADQTAKATCAKGQAAADSAATGTGAQADAFNAVFGISTQFSSVAQIDNQGRVVGAATTATAASVASSAASSAATVAASNSASANSGTAAVAVPPSTSGNFQSFTGALGGVTAPAVTSLGNGQFQVEGNSSFNNQQNAVVRSCDVQNNQCANAANASGNKNGFTVAACNTQQSQCTAAAN